MNYPLPKTISKAQFAEHIEQEFCQGSAIALDLFKANVQFAQDTEVLPGGEVQYPIHEALNWDRVVRFGRQARATEYAAILAQETGDCWQAKLVNPRTDAKGKPQKYECRRGEGSKAYLPAIPDRIRQDIQQKSGVLLSEGSFWEQVEANPQIPIVLTEGGKKGLAAISQGDVAIALYGCNGGYRSKDNLGNPIKPYLIPDIERFACSGRTVTLAFDQDTSEKTRRRVNIALSRFGFLLAAKGCQVKIASWKPVQGKGLDDLIVQSGAEAWKLACSEAIPLSQWQLLQRLEGCLTYRVNLQVDIGDLSNLDTSELPTEGILAIASSKGTGKTKLISALTAETVRVLAITHRVALGRNLCSRLDLDYRGDIDKVKGEYFSEKNGYTLRIGSCVDGLLSIDPHKFAGCDLILDEATQVIRHLITSSTCSKDGKRPALLARFRELVRNAKRVIVADADLDNATLNYLKELRGDEVPVFLIQNDFQPKAYDCRLIVASDRSSIVEEVLAGVKELEPGKVLFVATDSRAVSKSIERIVIQHNPEKRVLILNSETSGGELERQFMQTPDPVLEQGEYDVVICSPSVATGVSIECQGVISKVYGIFTGVSSDDGDISQSLSRVREPVERVIWCVRTGSNYSKVSRSINPLEVRSHLQSQTTATVQLIRSSLKEDVIFEMGQTDWRSDPHIGLYSKLAAEQNRSMRSLRDALIVRLRFEGNRVKLEDRSTNPVIKMLLAQTRAEIQLLAAESMVTTETLNYAEIAALEQKESLTPEENAAISKFHVLEFYCLESLTVDDCLFDNEGRKRGELLSLEAQLFPGVALERTAKALEKQAVWNQGFCPWDIPNAELRRVLREKIGLTELIQKMAEGWRWCKHDLKPYADIARALAPQIKVALHFTVGDEISDTQVIHQLLSQLGIKFEMHWSRSVAGYEGQKLRTYALETQQWSKAWDILQRRDEKRKRLQQLQQPDDSGGCDRGSPVGFELLKVGGVPAESLDNWLTPDSLTDIRDTWASGDESVRAAVLQAVPQEVLKIALEGLDLAS